MFLSWRKLKKRYITFIIFIFTISCAVQKNKSYNLINTDKLQNLKKSNKKIGVIVPFNLDIPQQKTTKPTKPTKFSFRRSGYVGKCPDLLFIIIAVVGPVVSTVAKLFIQIEDSGDLVATASILEDIDYKNIELIYMPTNLHYDDLIILENKVYKANYKLTEPILVKNIEYVDGNILMKENKNKVFVELPENYDYLIKFHYERVLSDPVSIGSWYSKFCSLSFDIIPHTSKHNLKCYLDVLDKKEKIIKSFKNTFFYKTSHWVIPLVSQEKVDMMYEQKEIMMKNLVKAMLQELSIYGRFY